MSEMIRRVAMMMGKAPAITYTTWNPSDKIAGTVLSNGNLTTTQGLVRSIAGKSSGKWYWEISFSGTATFMVVGIAKSAWPIATAAFVGDDSNSWGYYTNGNKYTGGAPTAYDGTGYNNSAIIGVALDMDAGTLTFYKNGASQGTAFTGLSGTMYAAVGQDGYPGTITANFGATAFTYSPPGGFNAGLY